MFPLIFYSVLLLYKELPGEGCINKFKVPRLFPLPCSNPVGWPLLNAEDFDANVSLWEMLLIHFCATENALLKETHNLFNCQCELCNLPNTSILICYSVPFSVGCIPFRSWMDTIILLKVLVSSSSLWSTSTTPEDSWRNPYFLLRPYPQDNRSGTSKLISNFILHLYLLVTCFFLKRITVNPVIEIPHPSAATVCINSFPRPRLPSCSSYFLSGPGPLNHLVAFNSFLTNGPEYNHLFQSFSFC